MRIIILKMLIICGLFTTVDLTLAQTWTPASTPSALWEGVASSADGNKLIAGGFGLIYAISTNSGSTWITNTQPQKGSGYASWHLLASSADGSKLAGITPTTIWVSTNSGLTWLSNSVPGASFLGCVTFSADGTKLLAAVGEANNGESITGPIYISTNLGATMTPTTAPTNDWASVASSADGTKLIAAGGIVFQGGYIYASTNSGLTWTLTDAPTNNLWVSVASSADGSKIVAASWGAYFPASGYGYGSVYTSTNWGMTWTSNSVSSAQWESVASSADGNRLVAVAIEPMGWIYTSTNSGITWVSNNAPNDSWISVASSADGGKLVAAALGENYPPFNPCPIYISQTTPAPQLNPISSSNNFVLSWIIPSTNFVLQQNFDLTTANWVTLTDAPVLNLTNLHDEVVLSPTNSSGFFRLISQ
jgi:hypothetical protein